MPSRAARWISATTAGGKLACSRSTGGTASAGDGGEGRLVSGGMVDLEIVELAARAVAPEISRLGRKLGLREQRLQRPAMLVGHVLLDAIRAQTGDAAADVEGGLVNRIAEMMPGIA